MNYFLQRMDLTDDWRIQSLIRRHGKDAFYSLIRIQEFCAKIPEMNYGRLDTYFLDEHDMEIACHWTGKTPMLKSLIESKLMIEKEDGSVWLDGAEDANQGLIQYEKKREIARQNGRKGGRPKKTNGFQNKNQWVNSSGSSKASNGKREPIKKSKKSQAKKPMGFDNEKLKEGRKEERNINIIKNTSVDDTNILLSTEIFSTKVLDETNGGREEKTEKYEDSDDFKNHLRYEEFTKKYKNFPDTHDSQEDFDKFLKRYPGTSNEESTLTPLHACISEVFHGGYIASEDEMNTSTSTDHKNTTEAV